ncbi:MAG: MFS transporter [Defluviitaleaceae bacterium]|nr:MFS transporter [Defluviitaleaceae bacterium]MCL2240565.1 MFS transporter [Defluviitaleaceae bacterium]
MKTVEKLSDKLGARERFFFGLGDFFGGGAGIFMTVVYFYFLTEVMRIPPGMAGMIALVVRVWEAITDPMMGVLSDNTRSRWGRRRPGIFVGGFVVVAALGLLFLPIQGWEMWARIFFVTASWLFYSTVSSYIGLNYAALSGEISNDYRELNAANTLRLTISQFSTLVCATLPLIMRDALAPRMGIENAYLAMALTFGVIFGTVTVLVAVFSRERVPMPAVKSAFKISVFIKPLRVKCFKQMLLMYLFAFLTLDIVTTLFQHFMRYVAHRPGEASFVLGALVIAQLCMIPVIFSLTKKISKPLIFKLSIPIWLVGAFLLSLYSAAWPPVLIYVFAVFTGLGVCGCVMMPWLMFPDTVDAGEVKFGTRITGSFSGIMTFARQLSSAVGVAIVGWVMQWTGFDPALGTYGQPASAIMGFRGLIIVSAVLLLGIAFYFATRNKLTGEKSMTIKEALPYLREGREMPEELAARLEEVKAELV